MFDFFVDLFGEVKKSSFRYQVDSGKKIAIQGYKNILIISDTKIVIKLFIGELVVEGKNLKVKEMETNTIIVVGKISKVSTSGVHDEK